MKTIATALTACLVGLDAHLIHAEVTADPGPYSFHLIGLSEASVRESRVRVQAGLQQIGTDVRNHAVTVNLSPGEIKKSGGAFDLAIAAAILAALGKIPAASLDGIVMLGELSLTGALRPVRGVLPVLRGAVAKGITRATMDLRIVTMTDPKAALEWLGQKQVQNSRISAGASLYCVGPPGRLSPCSLLM